MTKGHPPKKNIKQKVSFLPIPPLAFQYPFPEANTVTSMLDVFPEIFSASPNLHESMDEYIGWICNYIYISVLSAF